MVKFLSLVINDLKKEIQDEELRIIAEGKPDKFERPAIGVRARARAGGEKNRRSKIVNYSDDADCPDLVQGRRRHADTCVNFPRSISLQRLLAAERRVIEKLVLRGCHRSALNEALSSLYPLKLLQLPVSIFSEAYKHL